MEISRREFLKLCGLSGLTLGLSQSLLGEIVKAFEEAVAGRPPVIWFQGASDAGCSVSLLNTVHPSIAEVLLEIISCNFHPNVMAASGDLAISVLEDALENDAGEFILVIEGAIPTADNGIYCLVGEKQGIPVTALEWTRDLGAKAKAVLAVGTCAAFGGIPAANPNPTGCKGVRDVFRENGIDTPLINLPGCPAHPDWIVGTIFHMLRYGLPELDGLGRPKLFYGRLLHDVCPNRSYFDDGEFARKFSDEKCLLMLGCKGPSSYSDCSIRLWNSGVNWCIGGGAPCIGCVSPDFPDGTSPFYAMLPDAERLASMASWGKEEVSVYG